VLSEGRIVESGTHAELLAHDEGVYKTLCRTQLEPADGEPQTHLLPGN
jgi:ABC-type multidrug transport system fused ATPase/permease subunit